MKIEPYQICKYKINNYCHKNPRKKNFKVKSNDKK